MRLRRTATQASPLRANTANCRVHRPVALGGSLTSESIRGSGSGRLSRCPAARGDPRAPRGWATAMAQARRHATPCNAMQPGATPCNRMQPISPVGKTNPPRADNASRDRSRAGQPGRAGNGRFEIPRRRRAARRATGCNAMQPDATGCNGGSPADKTNPPPAFSISRQRWDRRPKRRLSGFPCISRGLFPGLCEKLIARLGV
jgi:hypothetical protein